MSVRTLTLIPALVDECLPNKGDAALLFIDRCGFVVGTFSPGTSGTRPDGSTWETKPGWVVDHHTGGDVWEMDHPEIRASYLLPDRPLDR